MPAPSPYIVRASANRSAELFIYSDIGESWWGDTVAAASAISALVQKLAGKTISFVNCERGGRLGIKMTNGDGYIF